MWHTGRSERTWRLPACIKCNISLVLFSPGSVEADVGWGGKLNSHLMASCFRNICAKTRQNPLILFKVTIDNVGVPFFETQCSMIIYTSCLKNKYECTIDQELVECCHLVGRQTLSFHSPGGSTLLHEMKSWLPSWQYENTTPSNNAYLLKEQSCQISSKSDFLRLYLNS